MTRVALVTGANRGIGLEIVRQLAQAGLRTVLAARDATKGRAAADGLARDGFKVATVVLDVTDEASVAAAVRACEQMVGTIDVLVNNAGIMIDGPKGPSASALELNSEILRRTFDVNLEGPLRTIKAIVPGMRTRGYGRVVNVSSTAGQMAGMGAGFPGYRMSKAALNALTRIVAGEMGAGNIKINAMCPGWVRTDMGGPKADRSVAEGADTAFWLATLPDDGPSGGFFQDRRPHAW